MKSAASRRHGFSLVELLMVIGIIALLISILLPAISGAKEQAKRLQCANNLRQIGLAMSSYATSEGEGSLPRAPWKQSSNNLQLDGAGYQVPDTFGNSGYVGENNVPATIFLLYKTHNLPGSLFICPSGSATPDFAGVSPRTSSNWKNPYENLSYSLACPYPSQAAINSGFTWKAMMMGPEFAMMADINPGTRGGSNPPNNVVSPRHDATPSQMAMANSNNHRNKGQNVLYGDNHVEWSTHPYCGASRPNVAFRDNIYTAGTGDGGACGNKAFPVDKYDSVLLPTDDPNGN